MSTKESRYGFEPTAGEDLLANLHQGIVHPLPRAPLFVGRVEELSALWKFGVGASDTHVLALIGLGGAGKTAVASEFVSACLDRAAEASRLDGLFVWSFYVDQDVNNFLRHAYRYFSRGLKPESSGAGLLYRLTELLIDGGKNLVVLDGLERVQRPPSDPKGGFGELEDPLLRQAVTRLAAGAGQTRCLITTRFPVLDLHRWQDRGYSRLEIDQLDCVAARQLLRRHGVRGDDRALDKVIKEYGSHALTLDHIGAYLAEFCAGKPAAAARLEEPRLDSYRPEERKLARVLRAYEKALTPRELDLLARFCLFRTGTTPEVLHSVFSRSDAPELSGNLARCDEAEFRRIVTRLARLHLLLPEPGGSYTAHPAVRDHFYQTFTNAATAHRVIGEALKVASGIELLEKWERISTRKNHVLSKQHAFDRRCEGSGIRINTYNTPRLIDWLWDFLSLHGRVLSTACAGKIRGCIESLEAGFADFELPGLDFCEGDSSKKPWVWNHQRFSPRQGAGLEQPNIGKRRRKPHDDWPLLQAYKHVLDSRMRLATALREFFSLHGRELSQASAWQITECIHDLEAGDGSFQLSDLELKSSGVTLRLRPGSAKPEDPALLDALEEVIYHMVRSGNEKEAYLLYANRLGGREHLGKVIGEYARGARILRYFRSCPNDHDLAWYLRGIGDLRTSFELLSMSRPIWSRTVLCLQGLLPKVVREKIGWEQSRVLAAFLMGRLDALVPGYDLGWGEALVNADVPLLKGELALARTVAVSNLKNVEHSPMYVPEEVRTRLILAEIERREGRTEKAMAGLEDEAPWIFRSGSVEHLSLYHLIRSRVLTDQGQYEAADAESREGLLLTRQCGFGLAHIDFLNLRARLTLVQARAIPDREDLQRVAFLKTAERSALGALNGICTEDGEPASRPDMPLEDLIAFGALHPECEYAWGAADAIALLGESLAEQGLPDLARDALQRASDLQSTLKHPELARTEVLLNQLRP